MNNILRMTLILFFSLSSLAFEIGPVLPGSQTEQILSDVLSEALKTKTGCEITTQLFLQKTDYMQRFFGITKSDAEKIAQVCPKNIKTATAFFYSTPKNRPAKTYFIYEKKDNSNLDGWTHPNNQTDLYVNDSLTKNQLMRTLVHEMIITMDDKYHMSEEGFSKLGFNLNVSSESMCVVNRFLDNPYYQIVLASLRAFWMELRFADDLKDADWFNELSAYGLLTENASQVFEKMLPRTEEFALSAFQSQKFYIDHCTGEKLATNQMSKLKIQEVIQQDFLELKALMQDSQKFNDLMNFLTRHIAVSAMDSNWNNSGPRPAITPGGWSKPVNTLPNNLLGEAAKLNLPKSIAPNLQKESTEDWKQFQLKNFEKIKKELELKGNTKKSNSEIKITLD